MRFSIVLPTIGRSHVRRCLKSLANQDFPKDEYEAVVVEDGTRSKVSKCVKELSQQVNFRYLWQENKGPAAARNFGVNKARGEIIVFTDDDCEVPPDWLTRIDAGYRGHGDVVGVGGYLEAPDEVLKRNIFAQYESYIVHVVYGAGGQEVVGGFEVPTGGTNNLSYKKDIFLRFGGFDESFPHPAGEDADLKKRICDAGNKLLFIPVKVVHLRPYGFVNFVKQSKTRGIGAVYFQKKHGKRVSKSSARIGLLALPLKFLKYTITLPKPQLAWPRVIEEYFDLWAKIRS